MTEPRGVKSLINYTSGEGRIIRPKAVVLFALSLLLFLCLFYRISTLPPFAFDVLRSGELYHITEKGDVVNIYVLSIKNMRDREVTFRISVTRPDTMMVIGPAAVSVKAGEISHQNLILISRDPTAKGREVVFALKNPQGYELKRTGVFFSP